jgi:cytochrome P450
VVNTLIDKAEADPHWGHRTDILALLLRSSYDDGSSMSRQEISDELVALLTAGHETTASTLAWAFERLRRHPDVLAELAAEADTDANDLRQGAILEVQRCRTVIDLAGRHVRAPSFELGEWVIPQGYSIIVSISQLHSDVEAFPEPERFDPYRFVGKRTPTFSWVPFGGGTRRCVGAAFANVEMDVVLRTVLRHFTIEPTGALDEKVHSRGVAYTPRDGGRIAVHRR